MAARDLRRAVLACLLLWPDHGFTRGRATRPRQIQYLACPHFPACPTYPVKQAESRGLFRRSPRCPLHGVRMDIKVVWKRH